MVGVSQVKKSGRRRRTAAFDVVSKNRREASAQNEADGDVGSGNSQCDLTCCSDPCQVSARLRENVIRRVGPASHTSAGPPEFSVDVGGPALRWSPRQLFRCSHGCCEDTPQQVKPGGPAQRWSHLRTSLSCHVLLLLCRFATRGPSVRSAGSRRVAAVATRSAVLAASSRTSSGRCRLWARSCATLVVACCC